MSKPEVQTVGLGGSRSKVATYAPDLQSLTQSLLATLADFEFDYEQEREKTISDTKDMGVKIQVLEKLRESHEERRRPYLQQLAILQECLRAQIGLGS